MLRPIMILALAVSVLGAWSNSRGQVDEDFMAGQLDWGVWCPCQIKLEQSPITFPLDDGDAGDRLARIPADEASLGGNKCRYRPPHRECDAPSEAIGFGLLDVDQVFDPVADLPEPLGPSLVRPRAVGVRYLKPKNPYCTEEVMRRAVAAGEEKTCIQRQELRFQKPLRHDATLPMLYSLRFRMPDTIEDRENSIRWQTAQWKHAPISKDYCREFNCKKWGPSPYMAQRFDDGVLHVTIQDEHCRCVIASAPLPDGTNRTWSDGPAQYCASTHPRTEGESCEADLRVQYGDNPILSTALGEWVEMRYRVQAGRAGEASIEVHEGDRFIVRATGTIGYKPLDGEVTWTKFKVGTYRDYMPFVHDMDIDWLTVRAVE